MKLRVTKLKLSPPQILVLGFAFIILIGGTLLSLPFASASGTAMPFLDALFTAASATCVTGLVLVDTGTYFSLFGQLVILVMIQLGGLGFMTMATLVAFVLRKRISLKERLILQEAMNQGNMEGIVRLIRKVIFYSLTIELAAALILTLRWSFDFSFKHALYFGIFHAVSFFNNAGFDLFGPVSGPFSSLTGYSHDVVLNLVSMVLIVLGGIGFIVISDVIEFRQHRRLSLHSKIVLTASAALIVIGAIVLYVFEFTNPRTLGAMSWDGKIWAAFFQSVTPRSGGTNTIDIAGLRQASQFFLILLMFIGASPGSAGGGVKTTTVTVLVGAVIAMARGKEDIVLFRYRLGKEYILKATAIVLLALMLVVFVAMVLSTTEKHSFLVILFEVTSAFGTVGLSMGLTPDLTTFGKIMIGLLMFIGRLGPLTLAYALGPKTDKELYRYPEGKITIG